MDGKHQFKNVSNASLPKKGVLVIAWSASKKKKNRNKRFHGTTYTAPNCPFFGESVSFGTKSLCPSSLLSCPSFFVRSIVF